MSAHAPAVVDERSALHGFLRQQQNAFRNAAFGLSDEQAGLRSTSSELAVGTLIKHVTVGSRTWLLAARAAPGRPARAADAMSMWASALRWDEEDSLTAALEAYDEVCAQVLDAVATLDLDAAVPVPDAPWFPKDVEAWSVRWVWFHLLEELARHAGHADIIRESIDGATSIELLAGREDWADTSFVKPWRPVGAA
ncbi:DinB family protein [Nocardioides sp. Iso805N]|uniref:DinB family protein n=1 Tax=Nocardioides sp. Iso805N TaxID=1283287 RepID=UPI000380E956|nr:DinB family protein [Nocardioides sp. Iso805N]